MDAPGDRITTTPGPIVRDPLVGTVTLFVAKTIVDGSVHEEFAARVPPTCREEA
jgi:hypothetical protein